MEKPVVSIITPAMNSARFIEQTIQSVLRQDYPNVEYIIIDGGSTDGTLEILRQHRGMCWVSEKDEGQSDALNKGFRMAKGDIIAWLNADDTYNPGAVSSAVNYMVAHPEAAVVYSNCNHIDERGQLIYRQVSGRFDLASALLDYNLPQPTAFMRLSEVARAGYLNPRLHYAMDWDLFLRLGATGHLGYVSAVWANYRDWGDTKTSSHPEMFWVEALEMFREFFRISNLPGSVKSLEREVHARAAWMAGLYYCSKGDSKSSAIGSSYCRDAVTASSSFRTDIDFITRSLTDVALRFPPQPDLFAEQILALLRPSRNARRMILGYLYAARALMGQEEVSGQRWQWVRKAIRLDPRWIRNRGILALFLREGKKTLFGS